jgi:hypothetical protein
LAEFLTRDRAAEYLRSKGIPCQKAYLAKLATVGGGPVFRRLGSRTLYQAQDLDDWIMRRLSDPISSTSEAA